MKIGLELAEFGWDGGPAELGRTLERVVRVADDAGFDLIGVGDHVWQGPHAGGPEQPQLECFTTLAVIGASLVGSAVTLRWVASADPLTMLGAFR